LGHTMPHEGRVSKQAVVTRPVPENPSRAGARARTWWAARLGIDPIASASSRGRADRSRFSRAKLSANALAGVRKQAELAVRRGEPASHRATLGCTK
jgi:hypothetical protein